MIINGELSVSEMTCVMRFGSKILIWGICEISVKVSSLFFTLQEVDGGPHIPLASATANFEYFGALGLSSDISRLGQSHKLGQIVQQSGLIPNTGTN